MKHTLRVIFIAIPLLLPLFIYAHEAYVVPHDYFWQAVQQPFNPHSLDALQDARNRMIALSAVLGAFGLLLVNFLFRKSRLGQNAHRAFEYGAVLGPFFVRIAIAAAFFFSARSNAFLGPELELSNMPLGAFIKAGLYLASFLIAIGFLTELAALGALGLFTISLYSYGLHMITYANYLGEIIVLMLFGMRKWSLDAKLFGKLKGWRGHLEKYETSVVRVFYGVALMWTAITIKLLHPDIVIKVAVDWNLMQFHLLFPADPLLIALGAALVEFTIGLFILLGFELRLTVLISAFYLTLSLLYFQELVWPHLLLYGISASLLVQPEVFTIDHILFRANRRIKTWWKRPFGAHTVTGKTRTALGWHPNDERHKTAV